MYKAPHSRCIDEMVHHQYFCTGRGGRLVNMEIAPKSPQISALKSQRGPHFRADWLLTRLHMGKKCLQYPFTINRIHFLLSSPDRLIDVFYEIQWTAQPKIAGLSLQRPAPWSLMLANEGILAHHGSLSKRKYHHLMLNVVLSIINNHPQNQYSAAYCTSKLAGDASHVFGGLPPAVLTR